MSASCKRIRYLLTLVAATITLPSIRYEVSSDALLSYRGITHYRSRLNKGGWPR